MSSGTSHKPLALAALALLVERPMHPYEMYQLALQRRDHRLIKIRPGTLYHAVGRLADAGLVRAISTERDGNRPERTTYEITDEGREVLRSNVATMIASVEPEYPIFPFALGEAHNLPTDEVVRLLTTRLAAIREDVAEIDASRVSVQARQLPWAYWLQLDYLHATYTAQADWLERALADIEAGRFETAAAVAATPQEVAS